MKKKGGRDVILELKGRMGEVSEFRAVRWLEELEKSAPRSPKERLIHRIEGIGEAAASRWLAELDARSLWPKYRETHEDFCFGLGFGSCQACDGSGHGEPCPFYDCCKSEHEAAWPASR